MDVVIWRGWGFLVALIPLVCLAIGHVFAGGSFSRPWDGPFPHLMHTAGFVAAGVILWFLGRKLNGSVYSDEGGDGEGTHSYCFIRMEYWGVFLIVGAVLWYMNPSLPKRAAASPDAGRPGASRVVPSRR